jgi:hypothetical protein
VPHDLGVVVFKQTSIEAAIGDMKQVPAFVLDPEKRIIRIDRAHWAPPPVQFRSGLSRRKADAEVGRIGLQTLSAAMRV